MGKFSNGVKYLLNHPDNTAARQLIIIGQQNNVENNLSVHEKEDYKNFYLKYDGNKIIDDTAKYLENYKIIIYCYYLLYQFLF